MCGQERAMRWLTVLLIPLIIESAFALEQGSFRFGEVSLGEDDKERIKIGKGNGRIIAYESGGAIVFSRRDGTEYGFDV